MSQSSSKSVNVFLSLDPQVIESYFNRNDPAPLYKRQLSHQFEQYIALSVEGAKRYDAIFYKLLCKNEVDQQYAEPLMYAIRRFFDQKKAEKIKSFEKFKRRNWAVLAISLGVVILFQCLLPVFIDEESKVQSGLVHLVDVFAWVILWHPIDELIFNWNPHLKAILKMKKLATAESIIVENEKRISIHDTFRVVA
jgi:hypothetical protein